MDRDEYVQRMEEKFSDTSTYVKIQKDPTQEIRQEIIDQLIYLEDSGYIDKKHTYNYTPTVHRYLGRMGVQRYIRRDILSGRL